MKFVCHGGDIISINDKQIHYVNSQETMRCFEEALHNVELDKITYADLKLDCNDGIHLYPREDGNYSMIDELFQFIPNDKWASVAISGKDGKPFYIKDKNLRNQIIMRCETSIVGEQGNNHLLNKIIDDVCRRPKPKHKSEESYDDWIKRYNE
jgi:hypothetical protein